MITIIIMIIANTISVRTYANSINRIYNKILDRDWFSARLFVT